MQPQPVMDSAKRLLDHLIEQDVPEEEILFGASWAMLRVKEMVHKIAPTNIPVLIRGESGTGKEVLAKHIHLHSLVRQGPFVKVNCAALPGPLLESELFGYEKGSFTGAADTKPGKVEMAQEGTLFLDEIGEMPPSSQTKLLHFLQGCVFSRIGGHEIRHAQVRIVCATNCNLEEAMVNSGFRRDLFYRIDVVSLHLPPLRERSGDIEILSRYFLQKLTARFGRAPQPLSPETLALMKRSRWTGNVRELENWIARYVVMQDEESLRNELRLRLPEQQAEGTVQLRKVIKSAALATQRELILRSLDAHHWNRRKVARDLQISYRALLYKIREAGISR